MDPAGSRLVDWDGHLMLVHANERQRRAGVAAWVQRGFELGAKIVYIEPRQEPVDRSFLSVLREQDIATDQAVARGQLQVLPADDEAYSAERQANVVDAALAEGYPTVRWSGEASTGWDVLSASGHAAVEWAADALCRTRPVSMLCQYPADLVPSTLQTACAMHGDGVRGAQCQIHPRPDGVAVAGEVDASNERVLRSALMAATATVDADAFVVELSRLSFLDAAGARALFKGTNTHRARGGRVCLRALQPRVERLLRLFGVDRVDGFIVEGA
ncbi:MAG: MEDS domain-containing protein [Nocardioidaceae bacterium]